MTMMKIIVSEWLDEENGSVTVLSDSLHFDNPEDRKAFTSAVRDFIRNQKNLY